MAQNIETTLFFQIRSHMDSFAGPHLIADQLVNRSAAHHAQKGLHLKIFTRSSSGRIESASQRRFGISTELPSSPSSAPEAPLESSMGSWMSYFEPPPPARLAPALAPRVVAVHPAEPNTRRPGGTPSPSRTGLVKHRCVCIGDRVATGSRPFRWPARWFRSG